MFKRTIIPGPPGTGKTFRLVNHYMKMEKEIHNTPLNKIGFFTFSKKGIEVAIGRVRKFFNVIDEKDLKYFCTLHALGKRECGIDTKTQLLQGENWNLFRDYIGGIVRDIRFDSTEGQDGVVRYASDYVKVWSLARAKMISLETQFMLREHENDISFNNLQYIYNSLLKFKKESKMFEFIDMLSLFIEKQACPPLEAVFLDEAQDLNNLQWKMFHYIESNVKRSYIAGDDDQAIMEFQGANPAHFVKLCKDKDTIIDSGLDKSRRVPKKVFIMANQIINTINPDNRVEKNWIPADREGHVKFITSYDQIDYSKGKFLLLTRTNKMLSAFKDYFEDKGYFYYSKNEQGKQRLIPNSLLRAIDCWEKLNQGESLPPKLILEMYGYITTKGGGVEYGFKNGKTFKGFEQENFNIEQLRQSHGLKAKGSWQIVFDKLTSRQITYIEAMLKNGEDLKQEARIRLSTIHSAKGDECDNVVLSLELDNKSYRAYLKDRDPETRLMYTGMTRTKENLYLISTLGAPQYQI
jgi:superfamily I DNA/RNA helicase